MASSASDSDDGIVGINVTPLVDITLVLLIIFMVTAKLIVSQAVPYELPKAATAGETQVVFTIDVAPDGKVSVEGRTLDDDAALQREANQALRKTPAMRTIIQASAAVPHGTVIRVLDVLRQLGVTQVAFAVDPRSVRGADPHRAGASGTEPTRPASKT